ncbi:MAG: glycine-rich protein [Tenericutes bacterium]|nr:glycine-rich protein [Mycoplasmatota bacterium]
MKKMNNRGFVISTVLYTLVIMIFLIVILLMSLMAASRRNSKNLIDTIEDELDRYSETKTDLVYDNNQDEQVYIVPYGQAGWYYIQLWGASGGDFSIYHGGYGGYTSGLVYLAENTHVTFYIGRAGGSMSGETYIKANTGGAGTAGKGAGGGGATTMQINGTNIMIAAGGGGANAREDGAPAGGIKGGNTSLAVTGGTQTSPGRSLVGAGNSSKGGSGSAGGGSGLYGGGAGDDEHAGAGGSSYIIGYTATDGTTPTVNVLNPLMIGGTNQGNGRVSIELMTQTEPVAKTDALNNVRYIRDCDEGKKHSEIQVISTTGQNIAYHKTSGITRNLTDGDFTNLYTGAECVTIDLGSVRNDIAEISVWHKFAELYEIHTSTNSFQLFLSKRKSVSVSSNNSSWTYLKLSQEKEVPEDSSGLRFSRYQNTTVKYSSSNGQGKVTEVTNLPAGNYYIISALGKNQALEAKSNYDDGTGSAETRFNSTVQLSTFTGNANQRWTIEKVDDGYRIIEADSHYAMQVVDSLSQAGSRVNTSSAYGSDYGWTKWKINSLGDGTYNIYPVIQKDATKPTYLATSTEKFYDETASTMQLSYKNELAYSQRFYLININ